MLNWFVSIEETHVCASKGIDVHIIDSLPERIDFLIIIIFKIMIIGYLEQYSDIAVPHQNLTDVVNPHETLLWSHLCRQVVSSMHNQNEKMKE